MKTGIKLQRLSAAIASVAMSLAIVCSISAYAYPGASASRQAMMAKKSAFPAKVVMAPFALTFRMRELIKSEM